LQVAFNNALYRLISYSLNKIMQGIKANIALSLFSPENNKILKAICSLKRINTKLAIKFATNIAKEYYNSCYTLIKLSVNNIVYLKLYKGYYLLNKPNRKILKQRTKLFRVIEKVKKLIYKLNFPF
jgi:hypothetical protein